MISIIIPADDITCFQDLIDDYKDNCLVIHSHGMDMQQTVQITIDLSGILQAVIPSIVAAVELFFTYKLQKKANELSEQSMNKKDPTYIKITSKNGKKTFTLIRAIDDISPETIEKDKKLLKEYEEGMLKEDECKGNNQKEH